MKFQKRVLPHVHMLLILENNDKLRSPKEYEAIVRTKIPNYEEEPQLHHMALKHMIHGPCNIVNLNSPCMKDGRCKKKFPKKFSPLTRQGSDSYLEYKRRSDDPVSLNRRVTIDNRWVVPYNTWLLLKYDCHINVEKQDIIYTHKFQNIIHGAEAIKNGSEEGTEGEGPTSWEDLLTVNGTCYPTFKQSAQEIGFLEGDDDICQCLVETSNLRTPIALRRLFVTMIVLCEPTHVRSLWEEFESYMVEDYPSTSSTTGTNFKNKLRRDLNDILLLHGKQISDFDLPPLPLDDPEDNVTPRIIQ
ncbi:hypothetical protein Lal_00021158 [Lupinus albus]|nr:hypothetical protein Lal_00021158 [Lupinus albus]